MWIRSQDRRSLSNVNQVLINTTFDESKYYIYGFLDRGRDILGEYSTQEKALSVLDEIQNIIANGKIYSSTRGINEQHIITNERVMIYLMPSDEDV